jgi:hypothetical protein
MPVFELRASPVGDTFAPEAPLHPEVRTTLDNHEAQLSELSNEIRATEDRVKAHIDTETRGWFAQVLEGIASLRGAFVDRQSEFDARLAQLEAKLDHIDRFGSKSGLSTSEALGKFITAVLEGRIQRLEALVQQLESNLQPVDLPTGISTACNAPEPEAQ